MEKAAVALAREVCHPSIIHRKIYARIPLSLRLLHFFFIYSLCIYVCLFFLFLFLECVFINS
jgi:hypothetical protein